MSDIFHIASIGMLEGRHRLEAVGLNAASASLPGFRRHVVVGPAFDATLTAPGASPTNTSSATELPPESAFLDAARPLLQAVDLRRGEVIETRRPLDLAIEADDLFFALTDGTRTWLTRAGSFRVNEEGVLVGERGLRLIGAQGDIRLPGEDVQIAPDGRITHAGVVVGAVQLFRPADRQSLLPYRGALLEAPSGVLPAEAGAGRLRSGALEASNTDAAREMLALISLSRQFEALSQVVQGYDQMLGRAIEKLGEV